MKGILIFGVTKLAVRLYCSVFVKLQVHGLNNLPRNSGAILVANHRSRLDGFLLYSLMDRMSYSFIKSDYFKNPFVRWYLKGGGGIPVKKGDLRLSAMRVAQSALSAGGTLLVFPEGHINEGDRLLPFENTFVKLSLKYRVPVVPAIIVGTDQVLPDGKWFPRPSRIQVIVKEPIRFNGVSESKDFIDSCVHRVRDTIEDTLKNLTAWPAVKT